MSHGLTAMVFVFNFVAIYQKPIQKSKAGVFEYQNASRDHVDQLAYLGTAVYFAVAFCMFGGFLFFKSLQGKSWENVSVRSGLYLVKAAMIVAGQTGPLLYFCLIMQIYNFSLIINHRRESRPGATFPLQCYFVYFTMQQYFYRSNHRERFDSIQYGKVCPGGVYCGEAMHWILIFFEILAPYILCLLLCPLVVKAKISHAYAMTKKNEYAAVTQKDKKGKGKKVAADDKEKPVADPLVFVGNMEQGIAYI